MKKMKTRTKLAGAVTALVVAVACSAGTTFAWFTASNSATVSSINAKVTTAAGDLSVAVLGSNDTVEMSTVSSFDYQSSIAPNASGTTSASNLNSYLTNFTFVPVAGTIDISTYSNGVLAFNTANYGESGSSTTSGYLRIPLVFRTATEGQNIYLGSGSSVANSGSAISQTITTPDSTVWTSEYSDNGYYTQDNSAVSASSSVNAEAKNAVRVGFTQTLSLTSKKSVVWSPNEAKYNGGETTANESHDRDNLGSNNYCYNNLARDYYNLIKGQDYTKDDSNCGQYMYEDTGTSRKNYVYELGNTYEEENIIATTSDMYEADDGYYYVFVVLNIWIEGTDGDCFNSITNQTISTILQFNLNPNS